MRDPVLVPFDERPKPPPRHKPVEVDEQPAVDWTEPLALAPFDRLMWQDEQLVRAGFPAMSPWWKTSLRRFYMSGKRWGVYRVGRGGGKSTTLCRVASCEGLFTEREIPPGQRWIWPFISAGTLDARRRIVEIQAILRALGLDVEVKHVANQPGIETSDARGQPIAWIATAATIAATSGPTTLGATCDEEAKWKDRANNANPAREIIGSLVQTFRARDGIRALRCSSRYDEDGSHAQTIREGSNEANEVGIIGAEFLHTAITGLLDVAQWEEAHGSLTAGARLRGLADKLKADSPDVPSWVANPTLPAIALRREIEALPMAQLAGLSRSEFFLRECASAETCTGASSDTLSAMRYAAALTKAIAPGHKVGGLCAPGWATGPRPVRRGL